MVQPGPGVRPRLAVAGPRGPGLRSLHWLTQGRSAEGRPGTRRLAGWPPFPASQPPAVPGYNGHVVSRPDCPGSCQEFILLPAIPEPAGKTPDSLGQALGARSLVGQPRYVVIPFQPGERLAG